MMKRLILILLALNFMVPALNAQNIVETEEEESLEVEHVGLEAQIDSTLLGKDIFSALPSNVNVDQTPEVRQALVSQVENNAGKLYSGFRIRLYFDSKRGAREQSAAVIKKFNERYPTIEADRSFESPNFKVTAGYFRTRLEADALLNEIKADFPNAFVVRDKFRYPTIGKPEAVYD